MTGVNPLGRKGKPDLEGDRVFGGGSPSPPPPPQMTPLLHGLNISLASVWLKSLQNIVAMKCLAIMKAGNQVSI